MSKWGKELDQENQHIYEQYFKNEKRELLPRGYWCLIIPIGLILGFIITAFFK